MGTTKTVRGAIGRKYDSMMRRCYNEKDGAYKKYGAKGIRVCSDWIKDIDCFRSWFLKELSKIGVTEDEMLKDQGKWQVDRIEPNGHYTPLNCRVTTRQSNVRNKAGVQRVFISAEGEEIQF